MSTTEVKELVEKGITALKAGDRDEARFWLAEAIQQDARNERAWVYLAAVLPRQQAIAALERVLVLNPENQKAQKGLNTLRGQSPQTATAERPARPAKNVPKPSIISRSDRKGRRQERDNQAGKGPAQAGAQPTNPFTTPLVIQMRPVIGPAKNGVATDNGVFGRGYHPLDKDREAGEKEIHPHHEAPEEPPSLEPPPFDPAEFSERVRHILTQPYPVIKPPRRLSPTATMLLILLPVVLFTALIYFVFLSPSPAKNNQPLAALATATNPSPATISNLSVTRPPQITAEPANPSKNVVMPTVAETTTPPTPTSVPTPTVPAIIKVDLAQNERAILRGFAVTFSNYENRSNNFSFAGAGTPKNGYHFEGVTISLENIGEKLVPIQVDAFQGVDGRNNYLKPLGGGRVPSMDISRLQMGEQRSAWLTFEVEDGTTLRRVTFSPTSEPDLNNSASVNLTLPPVTPAPVVKPTPRPTATPKPTATPLPTATPAPTATPLPTPTIVVAASPGAYAVPVDVPLTPEPTEIVVSPSPQPTAEPTATPAPTVTPEPTSTPLLTRLPAMLGQLNQRLVLDNFAVTLTAYAGAPTIKPPPLILPPGYHYETVKITVDKVGENDVSDYLGSYPFFLRDGDDRIFSVGPQSLEAADRFNPQSFAPTVIGPGKNSVTGVLYFLVRDNSKLGRTFIFYANSKLDSPRIEIPLK